MFCFCLIAILKQLTLTQIPPTKDQLCSLKAYKEDWEYFIPEQSISPQMSGNITATQKKCFLNNVRYNVPLIQW